MARSISFDVAALDKASKTLESVGREVADLSRRIDGAGGTIEIDADTAKAREQLAQIDAQLGRLNAKSLKVDADVAAAKRDLQVLEAEAKKATGDRKLKVDGDITAVQAKLRALEASKVAIDLETGAAQAKVALLKRSIDGLDGKAKVGIDVDAAGAFGKLAQLGNNLRAVQTPVAISVGYASVMEALAWVQRLGGGLASLGAVAVVSGGVAAASFQGIGDALKATGEEATKTGGSVAASASSIRSATRGVEQAQRDLRDAYAGVAQAEREVELSKRDVVAAERGVERATRDIISAQKDLASADQDIIRAEGDLERARRSAIRTLQDYETRTRGMALSQKDASLAVREAQARLNEVMADDKATGLERERAALSLEQARQREADLTIEATRLVEDKTEVDKKGVDQSDQVASAQDRLASAHERQQDAAQGVADAQVALLDAQQKVGDAQQGVADALQGVKDAHEKVELATQRVADAQLALAEAMKPSGGSTQVDKVAESMKNLTPEGKAFVLFLRELIDGPLKELQDTAQSNFLPGLQDGIQGFMDNIGGAEASIKAVATSFGDFFRDIGPSAGQAADAFLRLANLGAETTFEGLAGSVTQLLDRFTAWANSQSAADIQADIRQIGDDLQSLWDKGMLAFRGLELGWTLLKAASSGGREIFNLLTGDLEAPVRAMGELYEAIRKFADRIPGLKGDLPPLGDATRSYGVEAEGAKYKTDGATTAVQRLDDAARNLTQEFLSSEQGAIRYEGAVDRLEESIKRNGRTMDVHTQAGRDNRQALLDLISSSNDTISSMQGQGRSVDDVKAKYQEQRQKLIDVATQLTGNRTTAQQYIDKLLQVPSERNTTLRVDNFDAINKTQDLINRIAMVNGKTVTIQVNANAANVREDRISLSHGGLIPGAPSDVDTVPLLAAQGEFVVRSSAASKYGPLLEAINRGGSPTEIAAAAGGLGGIPVQSAIGGGGGGGNVILQFSNALVGQEDVVTRAVVEALARAKGRGLLPQSFSLTAAG